jgi:hypothetical protein
MIEWKEHEHEFDDIAALQDPQAREAFTQLWLAQVFQTSEHEKRSVIA